MSCCDADDLRMFIVGMLVSSTRIYIFKSYICYRVCNYSASDRGARCCCDDHVCLSVCLSVCLHIFGTTPPAFTKFCERVTCGQRRQSKYIYIYFFWGGGDRGAEGVGSGGGVWGGDTAPSPEIVFLIFGSQNGDLWCILGAFFAVQLKL